MKSLKATPLLGASLIGLSLMSHETEQDKMAVNFLEEGNTILRQDPRDDVFGLRRIPTLHGRSSFVSSEESEKKAYSLFNALSKDNTIALASWGQFKNGKFQRMTVLGANNQLNHVTDENPLGLPEVQSDFFSKSGPDGALDLYLSGHQKGEAISKVGDTMTKINFRAVFASSQKCMRCHEEPPKGKPIGVIALIRVPKKSGNLFDSLR